MLLIDKKKQIRKYGMTVPELAQTWDNLCAKPKHDTDPQHKLWYALIVLKEVSKKYEDSMSRDDWQELNREIYWLDSADTQLRKRIKE